MPLAFTYLATLPRPPPLPVSPATLHALVVLVYCFTLSCFLPVPPSEPFIFHRSCCKPRYGTCEEALEPPPPAQDLLIGSIRSQSLCSSAPLLGPSVLSVSLSVCSLSALSPALPPRAASADGFGPGV